MICEIRFPLGRVTDFLILLQHGIQQNTNRQPFHLTTFGDKAIQFLLTESSSRTGQRSNKASKDSSIFQTAHCMPFVLYCRNDAIFHFFRQNCKLNFQYTATIHFEHFKLIIVIRHFLMQRRNSPLISSNIPANVSASPTTFSNSSSSTFAIL